MKRVRGVCTHRRPGSPPPQQSGNCIRGDRCPYAHNVFEYWLHPTRYRTQLCNDGQKCTRRVCFFAHTLNEVRVPKQKPYVSPEALAAASLEAIAESCQHGAPPAAPGPVDVSFGSIPAAMGGGLYKSASCPPVALAGNAPGSNLFARTPPMVPNGYGGPLDPLQMDGNPHPSLVRPAQYECCRFCILSVCSCYAIHSHRHHAECAPSPP